MVWRHSIGVEDRDAYLRTAAPEAGIPFAEDLPGIVTVDERQMRQKVKKRVVWCELVLFDFHQEFGLGQHDFFSFQ